MLNYGPSYTLMILTNMKFGKACCGSDKQHLMNACDGVNVFVFFNIYIFLHFLFLDGNLMGQTSIPNLDLTSVYLEATSESAI